MRSAAVRAVAASCFRRRSVTVRTLSTCGKRVVDLASRDGELRVFIVAGEVSGDSIASRLMVSLKRISPFPVRFSGVGGALMYQEGLHSLFLMEDISVMGIFELLPYLNRIRVIHASYKIKRNHRSSCTVPASCCGDSRFKRILFSSVEAPKSEIYRGKGLSYMCSLCRAIILGMERRSNRLAAAYVGHPSLEDALYLNMELDTLSNNWRVRGTGDAFRQQYGIPPENTIITLLPGSRLQEVKRMLPIFSRTMELLNGSFARLSVIILVAPHQHVTSHVEREICSWPIPTILISGKSLHQRYDAFSASRVALCTSGSAVMELQLAGVPSVVAYRAHFLTEWLIRHKTKLQFISLPNILLDSEVIPEVLFRSCTCKNLATTLRRFFPWKSLLVQVSALSNNVLPSNCNL